MGETDKKLLNLLQDGLPLCERPFLELARRLGVGEDEVLSRTRAMKGKNVIRRIGGVFDSGALGFVSTLCAMSVPDEKLDETAEAINRYACVTHNYLRGHAYNVWFTVTAPSQEQLDFVINALRQLIGLTIHSLPAIRKFKIDARFKI
jgi:DNA-binding Lrp family transcriptional regulator